MYKKEKLDYYRSLEQKYKWVGQLSLLEAQAKLREIEKQLEHTEDLDGLTFLVNFLEDRIAAHKKNIPFERFLSDFHE